MSVIPTIPAYVRPDADIHLTGMAREVLRNMRNKVVDTEQAAQGWGAEAAAEAAKVRESYSYALATILEVGMSPDVRVVKADDLSLELHFSSGYIIGITWMKRDNEWYIHS